jgi:hypothetical protein
MNGRDGLYALGMIGWDGVNGLCWTDGIVGIYGLGWINGLDGWMDWLDTLDGWMDWTTNGLVR